jgi:hypothetical protein
MDCSSDDFMCDRPASKLLIFWGPGQRVVASTFVQLRPDDEIAIGVWPHLALSATRKRRRNCAIFVNSHQGRHARSQVAVRNIADVFRKGRVRSEGRDS